METKIPTSEEEIDFSTGHYSDITVLEYELRNHPHKTFVNYLCDGLRYGFDTKISRTDFPTLECRNTVSARSQCKIVGDLIEMECENGFMYGPFDSPSFDNYRISPLGVAEGKYSKKKRLILDLSSPHQSENHCSINDLDWVAQTLLKIKCQLIVN
jgi:hypothetical protein